MTDIPITHKEFEPWFNQHKAAWPAELQKLGGLALRTLWVIDNNAPSEINAMQEFAPNAWRSMTRTMMNFAEAYGAMRRER